jgi:3-methyladenine DNA glycosylase AlkD
MAEKLTAARLIKELKTFQSDAELKKYERYFPVDKRDGDKFIGVRMGQVFDLAKRFIDMPVSEIEKLMESDIHEIRAGALSIMGKSASAKRVTPERLKELYDLYIRRHDRIDNWDFVDLAAHQVVGRYLSDKPRDILYKLAKSNSPWERRTAIVATSHFMLKLKQTEDALAIAEILRDDEHDFVQKAVGWMLRVAGDIDRDGLIEFLEKFAATMPRVMLRNAIEKFDPAQREYYLKIKAREK